MSDSAEPQLSTGQIARLLRVHPSTIKRWFDRGNATAQGGKHRRIPLSAVMEEAEKRAVVNRLSPFRGNAARVWEATESFHETGDPRLLHVLFNEWLKKRQTRSIGYLLVDLGMEGDHTSAALLDRVFGGFMTRVGEGWAEGRLRVGEERAASREVVEALISILELREARYNDPDTSPRAVVGSMEGDQHFIAPLLVRTLLSLRGWSVEYLGADVPLEEFILAQQAHRAHLVCVSFAQHMGPADAVRCLRVLNALQDSTNPFELALGGAGTRGMDDLEAAEGMHDAFVFADLVSFERWLSGTFKHTEEVR